MNNSVISQKIYTAKLKLYAFLLLVTGLSVWYGFWAALFGRFSSDVEHIKQLDQNISNLEKKISSFENRLRSKNTLTGDVKNIFEALPVLDSEGEEYKYILKTFFNELLVGINKPILLSLTFDEGWNEVNDTLVVKWFGIQLEVKNIKQLLSFLGTLDKEYFKLATPLVVNINSLSYDILKYNEPQVAKIRGNIYFLKK